MKTIIIACALIATSISQFFIVHSSERELYDVVVLNGRVINPESHLDAFRNLGISRGTIKIVTSNRITSHTVVDARGLVVAPGFLDLHQHGRPVRAPF